MKIVFLAGSYYPKRSAVGNCVANLAQCLAHSHEVTVIGFGAGDIMVEGVRFIGVQTHLQKVREIADNALGQGGGIKYSLLRKYTQFRRIGRLFFQKNALDKALVGAYLEKLKEIGESINLLVPVCMPFEAVIAAVEYKGVRPGASVVPFLFDQFSESATLYPWRFLRQMKLSSNMLLEERVLEASDKVLNITWGEHVEKNFPKYFNKLIHVEHPMLVKPKMQLNKVNRDSRLSMIYAGALGAGIREPVDSLEILNEFCMLDDRWQIDFYVPNSKSSIAWFSPYSFNLSIRLNEGVAPEVLQMKYAEADCLLSIGNIKSDQKVSKVYEYMALGLPIVHFYCHGGDETALELKRYPLGLCLCTLDDAKENARRLNAFIAEVLGKTISFDKVKKLFYEESPECIAEVLISSALK